MKVEKHILNDLKPLNHTDEVGSILDTMEELKFSHLPVVDEDRLYLGVICEDDLLEVSEESDPLNKHIRMLKSYSIKLSGHMFDAIRIIGEGNLSLLPVVDDENHYKGYISAVELMQDVGRQLTFSGPGAVLVIKIQTRDYQLAQIAQIVESEDARIIGLHLVSGDENEEIQVCLKINQTDLSRILKAFERYNYNVTEVFHQSIFDESVTDRYEAFMKYINP